MPTARRFTLRTRIALVVFASTGLALLCASAFLYSQLLQAHRLSLLDGMRFAGSSYAKRIEKTLTGLEDDAHIMGVAVQSLDPTNLILLSDVSAADQQQEFQENMDRIAHVFREFLSTHEPYTQLRLLSRSGNWQERVRINREGDTLITVPSEELQQKGGEPYVRPMQDGYAGDVYLSELTQNREFNRPSGGPAIRAIQPLRNKAGDIIGAVVINADAEDLLTGANLTVAPGFQVFAVSNSLDYISLGNSDAPARLVFHEDPDWVAPPFADQLGTTEAQALLDPETDNLVYWSAALANSDDSPLNFTVLAVADGPAISAPGLSRLQGIATVSVCLATLSALGAYILASRFLAPLTHLNEEIQRKVQSVEPVTFESRHNDEISDLASSFSQMVNNRISEAARLNSIVQGAADGIIAIRSDGTISEVNPAAERLFGYTADELIGQPINKLMPAEDAAHHHVYLSRSLLSATPVEMAKNREIFGLCKDGSRISLGIAVSRIIYGNDTHFIGLIRDNSEQKAAEAEVNALIAALQRSNEELDQFAYVASHDLKAPLRVINNAANWLAEDLEPHLTEDTQESLDLLRNRATRMERLLDDLLRHSRVGRDDGPAVIISGQELREELTGLLDVPNGMTVHFSDTFDTLEVRRMPLQIILLNLISNAIRHHDKAFGEVWVDAEDNPTEIVFSVKDNGPGIPEEYHNKIFEIFQTLKPRDEVESSGMGLALVKKHATLANAKISVESDGRSGSKFTLHWPKPQPQRTGS
ncbi:sensor histidine kinase [Phycobacter sp. K97]|uniref:sensor histidine kinase n=1 Tax=Phycobacter sedimenti TaxID=3133977 RepID=UPI0031204E5D